MEELLEFTVFSDLHVHPWRLPPVAGLSESRCWHNTLGAMEMVFDHAKERWHDAVIFCGDMFESHVSIRPRLAAETILGLAAHAKRTQVPTYVLPGNHDWDGATCVWGGSVADMLQEHGVHVVMSPFVKEVWAKESRPIGFLPFIPKALRNSEYQTSAELLWDREDWAVLFAHANLPGFEVADGVETPNPDFPALPQRQGDDWLLVNGHYHSPYDDPDRHLCVVGAPMHHSWRDKNDLKPRGFLEVQVKRQGVSTRRISLDAHYPKWYELREGEAPPPQYRPEMDVLRRIPAAKEVQTGEGRDAAVLSAIETGKVEAVIVAYTRAIAGDGAMADRLLQQGLGLYSCTKENRNERH